MDSWDLLVRLASCQEKIALHNVQILQNVLDLQMRVVWIVHEKYLSLSIAQRDLHEWLHNTLIQKLFVILERNVHRSCGIGGLGVIYTLLQNNEDTKHTIARMGAIQYSHQ